MILGVTAGEWYSSIGHMEDLVSEEMDLISSLKDFIVAEEAKLERLKEVTSQLKMQAEEAGNNMDKFLGKFSPLLPCVARIFLGVSYIIVSHREDFSECVQQIVFQIGPQCAPSKTPCMF